MSTIGVVEAAGEGLDGLGCWEPEDGLDAARRCRVPPQVFRSLMGALHGLTQV
jgi:hypothetical protein